MDAAKAVKAEMKRRVLEGDINNANNKQQTSIATMETKVRTHQQQCKLMSHAR